MVTIVKQDTNVLRRNVSLLYIKGRDTRPGWASTQLNYVSPSDISFIHSNPLDIPGIRVVILRILKNGPASFKRKHAAIWRKLLEPLRGYARLDHYELENWQGLLGLSEKLAFLLEKTLKKGCPALRTFVYGDLHILTNEADWKIQECRQRAKINYNKGRAAA